MTTIMRKEWLPTDMRKVLHVGPCNTPGGMAKVMEILSQNPPEGWQAENHQSHIDSNPLRKLLFHKNALKRFKNKLTGQYLLHQK